MSDFKNFNPTELDTKVRDFAKTLNTITNSQYRFYIKCCIIESLRSTKPTEIKSDAIIEQTGADLVYINSTIKTIHDYINNIPASSVEIRHTYRRLSSFTLMENEVNRNTISMINRILR